MEGLYTKYCVLSLNRIVYFLPIDLTHRNGIIYFVPMLKDNI